MLKDFKKINKLFFTFSEGVIKNRWLIIIGFVVLFLIGLFGLTKTEVENSLEEWLLEGNKIRVANEEFEKTFGNNEIVAVLIEADDVFSHDVLKLIKNFGDDLETEIPFADEVTSLTDIEYSYSIDNDIYIESLVPDEIPTDPEELNKIKAKVFSKEFLVNRIVTDDLKQTWLTLSLEPFPDTKEWHKKHGVDPAVSVGQAVFKLIEEKYSSDKLPTGCTLKPSGLPIIATEENSYYSKEGGRVLFLALIVAIIILIVVLRSFRGVVIPMLTTIMSIIIVYGLMALCKIKLHQQLRTIPVILGLGVSIGYSIHLFNFYKRHLSFTGRRKESVSYAVEHTGWAILFTALTTIASLFSFLAIPLNPIKMLGVRSALIVLAVYVIVMTLTPALLSFGKNKKPNKKILEKKSLKSDFFFTSLGKSILRRPVLIIVGFTIVIGIFIYGVTKVNINMDYRRSIGLKVPYVKRIDYIAKSKIGSMFSYNLSFIFEEENTIKDPNVLKRFEQFSDEVAALSLTRRVSSILDIIKDMNRLFHGDDPAYYRIPHEVEQVEMDEYTTENGKEVVKTVLKEVRGYDQNANLLYLYEMSGGSNASNWIDNDSKILRLFVESKDYDNQIMIEEFEQINELAKKYLPEAQFQASGSLPQFLELNNAIAIGELSSFIIALAVIMVLMMIVFRSVKAGLIGLIPNITPAIIVGGIMGFFDIPLDMYTMTIMPMLLGLAVDDTIHFITHTKFEYQRTGSYNHAVLETFRTVGKAIFMTSFIIILTFSMYFTSIVNIFIHLGLFVCLGIFTALISDYLMTPVLVKLLRPFGKDHDYSLEELEERQRLDSFGKDYTKREIENEA